MAKGPQIVPVVGARKRTQLAESLAAVTLTLSPGEVARIEAALPESLVVGSRYGAQQMAQLDSEK
jgi:aryl-alcohol dehydrogenase-like predicted oxidoreductase